MRQILRRRELAEDEWHYLEELPAGPQGLLTSAGGAAAKAALIIPAAQLLSSPETWRGWTGRLGVRVEAAARVEELVPELERLALIAFQFPNVGDGRGYSFARQLRERYGFAGEVRATGAVKCDQIFFMARSGFDAFELAPNEDSAAAIAALSRFTVAYTPGIADLLIAAPRFRAQRSGRTISSNN
jgi:uncharacterized protein (DUF934 family)